MKTPEVVTMRSKQSPEDVVNNDGWYGSYRAPFFGRFDFYQADIRSMLENCGAAVLLSGGVIYDGLWHTYFPEGGTAVNRAFLSTRPVRVDEVTDLFGKSEPYADDDLVRNLSLLLEKVTDRRPKGYGKQRIAGVRRELGRISRSRQLNS